MSTTQTGSTKVAHDKTAAVAQHSETASDHEEQLEGYRISWRTVLAIMALSTSWSSTTYAVAATNTAIGHMVASFPGQEANASWIANCVLFCIVTIPVIAGALSDRYGKKRFLIGGGIVGACGAIVAGTASSINTIIGGQVLIGVGASFALVCVAASMEIVQTRYRPLAFACMGILNGAFGSIGGPLIFAACVEHNLGGNGEGWRYGFYIETMLFAVGALAVFIGYHPPPTRFQREQAIRENLRNIDFIGIFLLALGAALLVIPFVWGGTTYAWSDAHVIAFFVVGPLVLIAFGVYEWKGRKDGILHHEFFWSPNFPILMGVGIMDGILLYSTGFFIPNQISALYTTDPFELIVAFTPFPISVLAGAFITGSFISKMKKLRLPLVVSCLFTALFCGLMIRCEPGNKAYFIGITAALGFMTAAITTVPVAGIALVVPSHLLATSNTLLSCVRALGGAMGIAIFTAVYRNKISDNFGTYVIPVFQNAHLPAEMYPEIIAIIQNAPQALAQLPNFTPDLIQEIMAASATANAQSYKYVWICMTAAAAACFVGSCFVSDVPDRMTDEVESALEVSKYREKQDQLA